MTSELSADRRRNSRADALRRLVIAFAGLALLGIGTGLTWYGTVEAKPVSAVGVGGLFVVGVLLVLAGFLAVTPAALKVTKDGVTLQLVAEAVKDMKESAGEGVEKAAADPAILDKVKTARTDEEAQAVVAAVAETITSSMPATADVTARALEKL
jgi:hypothetical protein